VWSVIEKVPSRRSGPLLLTVIFVIRVA
jgi:hypothetical protein